MKTNKIPITKNVVEIGLAQRWQVGWWYDDDNNNEEEEDVD